MRDDHGADASHNGVKGDLSGFLARMAVRGTPSGKLLRRFVECQLPKAGRRGL